MAQRFGRFWLHEKIGHGGMAEVFRATVGPDPATYSFDMALKRLHPHLQKDPAQVDMFFTEADVAKFLKHPNIVQVYESGLEAGQAYIAMEYLYGYDLASLVELLRKRRLRFPSDLAVFVTLQVLRALDYVHGASTPGGETMDIVHRDVTPSNIYLSFYGDVKLGDFGIAHVSFLESVEEARMLKGKVAYMPPEVLTGRAPVSQQVDLWSLAVTLYEMLTARRLYEGVPEADIMSGRPFRIEPVHHLNTDIHEKLSGILARALATNPKKRPADAVAFYRELKQHLRHEGVQVDAMALSRFVGAVTGSRPPMAEPRGAGAPKVGVFEQPAFQVPMQGSPTQRFELVRTRSPLVPIVLGASVIGAAVGGWLALRSEPAPVEAPAPTTAAVDPEPAQPQEPAQAPEDAVRARPDSAKDLAIDFSEELGDDFAGFDVDTEPQPNAPPKARLAALLHRGRVQAQRGRHQSAADAFAEALTLRPKHVPAMLGRANALIELRRFSEAEKLVRQVIKEAPKNARAYLLLGDVLWILGKDKEARGAYQRTVELDPRGNVGQTAQKILSAL